MLTLVQEMKMKLLQIIMQLYNLVLEAFKASFFDKNKNHVNIKRIRKENFTMENYYLSFFLEPTLIEQINKKHVNINDVDILMPLDILDVPSSKKIYTYKDVAYTFNNQIKEFIQQQNKIDELHMDFEEFGTVDGIIFADLLIDKTIMYGSDTYGYNEYNVTTITSSKDYYVSQENYTDKLGGTADVLTPTGEGNNRFYVIALNDFNNKKYTWYEAVGPEKNSITDNDITSNEFGTGKQNAFNMIEKWNNVEYGEQSQNDIWRQIQDEVNKGWFVPSSKEWAAFAKNIGVTTSNYSSKGLSSWYWSSSLHNTNNAYNANFNNSYVNNNVNNNNYVRLAASFNILETKVGTMNLTFEDLYEAYLLCLKNKKNKVGSYTFYNADLCKNLYALLNDLNNKNYVPEPSNC